MPASCWGNGEGRNATKGIHRADDDVLTRAIIALASEYGRYEYRRITVKLREAGWCVGKDRVERIWRREGLKVPQKQRPRRRLWLNDGSCVRLRTDRANHAWSYDFVSAMTPEGRTLRLLVLIDEFTRERLAIRAARRLGSSEVIETLADVMLWRGIPEHIRSDNGPVFVAKEMRKWLGESGNRGAVHRTGQSVGKRALREFQRHSAGRVLERRVFLLVGGGTGCDREGARRPYGSYEPCARFPLRRPLRCPSPLQPVIPKNPFSNLGVFCRGADPDRDQPGSSAS